MRFPASTTRLNTLGGVTERAGFLASLSVKGLNDLIKPPSLYILDFEGIKDSVAHTRSTYNHLIILQIKKTK